MEKPNYFSRIFMNKIATILSVLFTSLQVCSQVELKTVVPPQSLIAGESFQIQYILTGAEIAFIGVPSLSGNFRIVSGPVEYSGTTNLESRTIPVRNSVYTVVATRPGRLVVSGTYAVINGNVIYSKNDYVTIISKEEQLQNKESSFSEYFLRPGEDPYVKIRKNLFVKVMVSKRSCFVGEPLQATYKLYSRLESKSDIVKNPGFYGFTVYDMVNLSDKEMITEKINGQLFDVHTIRKVQLYPLQAGMFTLDPMQINNKVEFSRSTVNKKTEQKIAEGILGNRETEIPEEGTEVYETDLSTDAITINVKPLPDKNLPLNYNGATGSFSIASVVVKNNLSKNEEGGLKIIISGKGNFIQLSAPVIQWPAGIESFESFVKDSLDNTTIPLTGSRTFRYPFICTAPGSYQIPEVGFSFFDSDSNKYKTITTKNVEVQVSHEDKKSLLIEKQEFSIAEKSEKAARTAGIVVVSLVLLVLVYWVVRKKEPEKLPETPIFTEKLSIENLLEPAYEAASIEGNQFYRTLYEIIWKFAAEQFELSGSEMNKQTLGAKLNETNVDSNISVELFEILTECEAAMFTNASLFHDRSQMLSATKKVMEDISSSLL
jgi:hypothetical protein